MRYYNATFCDYAEIADNLYGIPAGEDYKGVVIRNGKKTIQKPVIKIIIILYTNIFNQRIIFMKKNLFMILAMFAIAFTTISFTSCTKDDDNSSNGDYVYSGKGTPTIYDPLNELTEKQKTDLQAVLTKTGVFEVMYTTDVNLLRPKYKAWEDKFLDNLYDYFVANPEVLNTSAAGVKVMLKGNGWEAKEDELPYIFSELKKSLVKE